MKSRPKKRLSPKRKSPTSAAASKPAAEALRRIPADALLEWARRCLVEVGLPRRDAQQIASSLVQSSLWGVDSHGIARLGHYLSRIQTGSIAPRPKIKVKRTGPCTAQVDGGHGHGIVICHRAMDEAIALAKRNGIG